MNAKQTTHPRGDKSDVPRGEKQLEANVDLSTPPASTAPTLPNERDETAGMTGGNPSRRVEQGHADIERGLEDTTRAQETDAAYRKLKK